MIPIPFSSHTVRVISLALVILLTAIIAGICTSRLHIKTGAEMFLIEENQTSSSATVITAFRDVLRRGPTPSELQTYSQAMVLGQLTLGQLEDILHATPEYASLVGPRPPQDPVDKLLSNLKTSVRQGTIHAAPATVATAHAQESTASTANDSANPAGWIALSGHALSEREVGGKEASVLSSFPLVESAVEEEASHVTAYSTSSSVGSSLTDDTSVGSIIRKITLGASPWVQEVIKPDPTVA